MPLSKSGNNKVTILFSRCFARFAMYVTYVNLYRLHCILNCFELRFHWHTRFCDISSVAFIHFISTGCFMDNVCHDPGYKFTKDCQEIQCRGGMMGFQVVKEGMRGLFSPPRQQRFINLTQQWIKCWLYAESYVPLLFLLV